LPRRIQRKRMALAAASGYMTPFQEYMQRNSAAPKASHQRQRPERRAMRANQTVKMRKKSIMV
jgi:hypothetical protein